MQRVTAAIIEKEGKILIAKRKKGDLLADKWEFPGGTIECGESPEECLQRELREEFGIETRVENFLCSSSFISPELSIELIAYRVTHVAGEFRLNVHQEARWVPAEGLGAYDFSEADVSIAREVQKMLRTEDGGKNSGTK